MGLTHDDAAERSDHPPASAHSVAGQQALGMDPLVKGFTLVGPMTGAGTLAQHRHAETDSIRRGKWLIGSR